jgi:hypothetical protein
MTYKTYGGPKNFLRIPVMRTFATKERIISPPVAQFPVDASTPVFLAEVPVEVAVTSTEELAMVVLILQSTGEHKPQGLKTLMPRQLVMSPSFGAAPVGSGMDTIPRLSTQHRFVP